jgi:hypothetical protein
MTAPHGFRQPFTFCKLGRQRLSLIIVLALAASVTPSAAQDAESTPDKRLRNAALAFDKRANSPRRARDSKWCPAFGCGTKSLSDEANVDVATSLRDRGRATLSNVHFATGKADISPDSEASSGSHDRAKAWIRQLSPLGTRPPSSPASRQDSAPRSCNPSPPIHGQRMCWRVNDCWNNRSRSQRPCWATTAGRVP